jgi:2-hydroxy-3-keto-5-methylthiopentenyl-1-phosphate phosphatase
LEIPVDPYIPKFIEDVKKSRGDFYILSAGTSYYIYKILEKLGIDGVTVISNPGHYENGGVYMVPDKESIFYSEVFGVDKAKAVEHFRVNYKQVFYAGDSFPDLKASMLADTIFAKGELQNLLKEQGRYFVPVDDFKQIAYHLEKIGVFKNEA